MNPEYPVYIVSKGRWESRLTSKALHRLGVLHYIVVEEQEQANYAREIDSSAKLLVLDPSYQRDYNTCDDLGDAKSRGPGPARNFVWDHSIGLGASYHWVMDDNIRDFRRWNKNAIVPVADGTIFRVMEDFVTRYDNVLMAGPDYEMFVSRREKLKPFRINTRIYSCNLIRNDAPYRWRGRYNEDTDLSLRMLKDGYCTILFHAFLQMKVGTQRLKGGNTEAFYAREGTAPKSQMLVRLHPDCSRLVFRYGRIHHVVDYARFQQPLEKQEDLHISPGVNNFGMQFQRRGQAGWIDAIQEKAGM